LPLVGNASAAGITNSQGTHLAGAMTLVKLTD